MLRSKVSRFAATTAVLLSSGVALSSSPLTASALDTDQGVISILGVVHLGNFPSHPGTTASFCTVAAAGEVNADPLVDVDNPVTNGVTGTGCANLVAGYPPLVYNGADTETAAKLGSSEAEVTVSSYDEPCAGLLGTSVTVGFADGSINLTTASGGTHTVFYHWTRVGLVAAITLGDESPVATPPDGAAAAIFVPELTTGNVLPPNCPGTPLDAVVLAVGAFGPNALS